MHKDYIFSFSLSLGGRFFLERNGGCEDWVQSFVCTIHANDLADDDADDIEIGEASGWIVPFYANGKGIDPLDAADAISSDCFGLVSAVVDPKTKDYYESLALEEPVGDILCMNQTLLVPQFRGRGIGLLLKWKLLGLLGRGCAVAVTKPCPINGNCTNPIYGLPHLENMTDKELAKASHKLQAYWSRLGFRPVSLGSDFYYFDLGCVPKTPPDIG